MTVRWNMMRYAALQAGLSSWLDVEKRENEKYTQLQAERKKLAHQSARLYRLDPNHPERELLQVQIEVLDDKLDQMDEVWTASNFGSAT